MRVCWGPAVLALLTGCGGTALVIESDTSWAGSVDNYGAISGQGKAEYDLGDAGRSCWTLAKTTEAGTLRVYSRTSQWFGLGDEVNGESRTSAPMGTVTGCVQ